MTRDELLNESVSQEPLSSQPDQSDLADHEAELFAKSHALKKGMGTHDKP